eukprot:Em0012g587a
MHAAVLIGLLLVVESNAVTAPSSQCAYFNYYYLYKSPLLPSLVPSISSECLAVANNPDNPTAVCTADCQSWGSLLSQCKTPAVAANDASSTCGLFKNSSCSTLQYDYYMYDLQRAVQSECRNGSYCSPNCSAAIADLEEYSGCCSADKLNGPKALCGQQTIAPCSTVLNSGSVVAPTSECAYFLYYGPVVDEAASRLPSVNAECIKRFSSEQFDICTAECQSYFALLGKCGYGVQNSDNVASLACGKFDNRTCGDTYSTEIGQNVTTELQTACSNSTYCPSSCVNAIAAAERYGGCCFAIDLNGPKVLCGQQPIAPCSTIVSSGSATITFNLFIVMLFIFATVSAV